MSEPGRREAGPRPAGPAGAQMSLLLDRALAWVEANLSSFEPVRAAREPMLWEELPLIELAVACMCLRRQDLVPVTGRVSRLLEYVADRCTAAVFADRLFRRANAFAPHALLLGALQRCGFPAPDGQRQAIQRLVDAGGVTSATRYPHQVIELRYVLELGGFSHALPPYQDLCRGTILGGPINPIALADSDVYCLTHVLYYLSDYGARPLPALPASDRESAAWAVRQLLGLAARDRNCDLTAELLLCWPCLGMAADRYYTLGWRMLAGAQEPDGCLAGPWHDLGRAAALRGPAKQRYMFKHCYHTVMITLHAAAACAAAGLVPSTMTGGNAGRVRGGAQPPPGGWRDDRVIDLDPRVRELIPAIPGNEGEDDDYG